MSNMGLEIALRNSGIRMLRANVGDKYVLEEMLKTGRDSGRRTIRPHYFSRWRSHHRRWSADRVAGDGNHGANQSSLADLVSDLKVFPQTIQNVRVREKIPFQQGSGNSNRHRSRRKRTGWRGRVVVRYSGTEALARVMVEAESEGERCNAEIAS